MRIARAYLWLACIASVLFGGAYLVAAEAVTRFAGIEHASPAGLTDLRATYAGFQLGMAALLGWCLRDASRYAAGLIAFGCVVGGLAGARLLGLLLDGFSPEMAIATLIELGVTGFALYALAAVRAEMPPSPASAGSS